MCEGNAMLSGRLSDVVVPTWPEVLPDHPGTCYARWFIAYDAIVSAACWHADIADFENIFWHRIGRFDPTEYPSCCRLCRSWRC